MKITELTRRDIIDSIASETTGWSGWISSGCSVVQADVASRFSFLPDGKRSDF